jgi:hypothetical protein
MRGAAQREIVKPNGERNVVAVKYDELSEAFDFVSFGEPTRHQAYLNRTTGEIYWVSEVNEDELPEDLDESDQYIAIPHKNDLDLGTSLALRFAAESLPDQSENRGILSEPRRIFPIQRTSHGTRPLGRMVRLRGEMHRGGSQEMV